MRLRLPLENQVSISTMALSRILRRAPFRAWLGVSEASALPVVDRTTLPVSCVLIPLFLLAAGASLSISKISQ